MAPQADSESTEKKETLLIYDDNYILNIGEHNNEELHEKAASLGNSTLVLLIYARKFIMSYLYFSLVLDLAGSSARVQQTWKASLPPR